MSGPIETSGAVSLTNSPRGLGESLFGGYGNVTVGYPMELIYLNEQAAEAYSGEDGINPQTPGSAGYDLRAIIDEDIVLQPGECKLIGSGLSVWIKYDYMAGQIIPRSGKGHKEGVVVGNLVGLIDSDYQGEIKISCWNRSSKERVIHKNERIAQLVFVQVYNPKFTVVESFSNQTQRGESGFGDSGKF